MITTQSRVSLLVRRGKAAVFGAAALGTMLSACVVAAVPVEESGSRQASTSGATISGARTSGTTTSGTTTSGTTTTGGTTPGVSTARLSELYYQLQTLQQEVQDLRGLVEEQAHQISRLQKDQKSQYLDLDRRMQGVTGAPRNSGSAAARVPTERSARSASEPEQSELRNGELYTSGANPSGTAAPVANSGAADSSERNAYSDAIALMKARQFDESILAFNRLVVDYPGGSYNGHAFYWLGELYLAKNNDTKARQQFVQVINLYPDHAKVPDALYKIGVVYHRQGDKDRALEYLNRVRAEYASSNAAKLAADYAKEMQ